MGRDREISPLTTQQAFSRRDGKRVWKTITVQIAEDLRIGRDLQKALRTSMSTFVWYAQLKEQAHAQLKQVEHDLDALYDEIYDTLKPLHPKTTETALKSKIHLDERWRKLAKRRLLWQSRYRMLDVYTFALRERNDNLRTLEATERSERNGKH